jgi:transcription initiation factor TFIID subunit 2
MIKLKVGSQNNKPPERAPQPPSTKQKKHKSKASDSPSSLVLDAPPPPYVDDGSHDILQEVLAIEREKNEQRHRSVVEKDRPVLSLPPGKRKKDPVEDDILALATPAKKERPSPPGPSTSKPPMQTAPSISKPAVPIKFKKDKPVHVSRPSIEAPVSSLKGKEREVHVSPAPALNSASTPTPAPVPHPTQIKRKPIHATPINEKKCKDLLKILTKFPEAEIFLRPVDPVLDGCPT